MVKIHDGSLVPASELLSNNGETDEGDKLKFEQVKDATFPTYQAKAKVPDDSGRERTYQFSIEDTNVTVHMSTSEEKKPEDEKKTTAAATETAVREVSFPSNSEAKKNSNSSSSEEQQKLNPPDFRLRKSPT